MRAEGGNLRGVLGGSKRLVHVPFVLMLAVSIAVGVIGLDYTGHPDEWRILDSVTKSVESGVFLPGWYNYPSLSYYISFAALLPDAPKAFAAGDWRGVFFETSKGDSFRLRVRGLFLLVSLLTVVWTYILVLSWRGGWVEALLAASLVGLSWEVGYHARWIAPDAVMMQFTALTVMLLFLHAARRDIRLLFAAAFTGGLAAGSKYPAVLVIVPILASAYFSFGGKTLKAVFPAAVKVSAVFLIAYLITTPGTIFDYGRFIGDARGEIRHYGSGHLGYTVAPGVNHGILMMGYFAMAVSSKFKLISYFFFIMWIVGLASIIREEGSNTVVFLSFPALYVFFMSKQSVMIARNLLVLIPFFAVVSARGCVLAYKRLRKPSTRSVFSILVAGLLLVNMAWGVASAESVRKRGREDYLGQLRDYVGEHGDIKFVVSDKVKSDLLVRYGSLPKNIAGRYCSADAAVFYSTEVESKSRWPANNYEYVWIWFGPREVNFNYYPTWQGDERILVMPVDSAARLAGLPAC